MGAFFISLIGGFLVATKKRRNNVVKQTVVFDFDGVIHSYTSGWQGAETIADPPVTGIREVIEKLRHDYIVAIVSTRCATVKGIEAITEWLNCNQIEVDLILKEKPPAIVYIDDRAICFDGNCSTLKQRIDTFKPWNE